MGWMEGYLHMRGCISGSLGGLIWTLQACFQGYGGAMRVDGVTWVDVGLGQGCLMIRE